MLLVSVIESVVKISFFFQGGGFLVTSTEQSISKANLCFGEIEFQSLVPVNLLHL